MAVTLGVDIGGVIIPKTTGDRDTEFFGDHPMQTPAVDGAFDTLARLAADVFAGRVHLVSKAGVTTEAKTRAWLRHHRFFEQTGIDDQNLHFVRDRRAKAPVCADLGVTHFVDDRLEVLVELTTVAHRYLFLGGGATRPEVIPDWSTPVRSWADLELGAPGRTDE
jgi:hypothetical protein